ncbi:MAG: extracellular solute-binding protein, partial [Clostridia bacterium]|nr:extracellular solute-binding protein [Clostridia bacterium]
DKISTLKKRRTASEIFHRLQEVYSMKKRRIAALLVAWAAAFGTLAGCSSAKSGEIVIVNGGSGGTKNEKQINVFGYKADTLTLLALENSMHGFMNLNTDINVMYEGVKGKAYWDAFDKRSAADVLDDAFMVDRDRAIRLIAEDKLADLSDVLNVEDFSDVVRGQMTAADGGIYFVPTCVTSYGMYVNYDLLNKHGKSVPESLEELSEVCDYFVSQNITPLVINNYSSLRTLIIAAGMYGVYQSENRPQIIAEFNSEPVKIAQYLESGINLVGEMISRKWIDCAEARTTSQASGDLDIFVKGERPFMITGSWASVLLAEKLKNGTSFNYGIHPYPVLSGGGVAVIDMDSCYSVNAESAYADEAKKLISYLTEPDVLSEYCNGQSGYTPVKNTRVPADKAVAPTTEYLKNGRYVLGSDFNINFRLDTYLIECGTGMLGGMSAAEAYALLKDKLSVKEGE